MASPKNKKPYIISSKATPLKDKETAKALTSCALKHCGPPDQILVCQTIDCLTQEDVVAFEISLE